MFKEIRFGRDRWTSKRVARTSRRSLTRGGSALPNLLWQSRPGTVGVSGRHRNIGTSLPANRDSSSGKLERCQKEISSPFPVDSHRERTIEIGWIWNKQSSKAWPPIRGSSSPFLRAAYGPTKA